MLMLKAHEAGSESGIAQLLSDVHTNDGSEPYASQGVETTRGGQSIVVNLVHVETMKRGKAELLGILRRRPWKRH